MIKSMTAFARIERKYEFGALVWELRSVNHRYLDANARLPEDLRGIEQAVRDKIAARVKRGKVDCTLRYKLASTISNKLQLDKAYAQTVIDACAEVTGLLDTAEPIRATEILRWPGVVRDAEKDFTPLEKAAVVQLDEALQELLDTREREGQRTYDMLKQRCQAMAEIVVKVRERRPELMKSIKHKITTRIEELDVSPNNDRLEQELVYLTQRMDVDEELDRLDTHLSEVSSVLDKKEPVGRRLDFLMQELNREANTLSSKSGDTQTTQLAVDLKVLIEQMREQVQNIE